MTQDIDITERPTPMSGKPRLIDRVRLKIRMLHYSRRTETIYVFWFRYFILHMGKRHPAQMGAREVRSPLDRVAEPHAAYVAAPPSTGHSLHLQY